MLNDAALAVLEDRNRVPHMEQSVFVSMAICMAADAGVNVKLLRQVEALEAQIAELRKAVEQHTQEV